MKRQAITPAMKISCLLYRWYTPCSLCGKRIEAHDRIEWDHIHALVHGGPHEYENLRPVHYACHREKSALDVKANAKIKRLRGETCQGPKRKIPARKDAWPKGQKLQSRRMSDEAMKNFIAMAESGYTGPFDVRTGKPIAPKKSKHKWHSRPFQKGRAA